MEGSGEIRSIEKNELFNKVQQGVSGGECRLNFRSTLVLTMSNISYLLVLIFKLGDE